MMTRVVLAETMRSTSSSGVSTLTGTGANLYNTFTIQAGATVKQTGPGGIRFGRVTSNGIAIIGGTAGSTGTALLQLGNDAWFTDVMSGTQPITTLLVQGSGAGGLRIEAPMDATYVDPSTNPAASVSIGTTGLFGVDAFAGQTGHTGGNVYTVLSPARAAALSASYNNGTATIQLHRAGR